MTDDLVTRLKEAHRLQRRPLLREAADRIEQLEAALREIESISVSSGGEIHGVTAKHWRDAFEQACDIARAALGGGGK